MAGSTFGFGGLFPLLRGFLLGAIFLVGVGGVLLVVILLFGLVRVILVSLVNMSVCWRRNVWNDERSLRLWGGSNGVAIYKCVARGDVRSALTVVLDVEATCAS